MCPRRRVHSGITTPASDKSPRLGLIVTSEHSASPTLRTDLHTAAGVIVVLLLQFEVADLPEKNRPRREP